MLLAVGSVALLVLFDGGRRIFVVDLALAIATVLALRFDFLGWTAVHSSGGPSTAGRGNGGSSSLHNDATGASPEIGVVAAAAFGAVEAEVDGAEL